MAVLINKSQGHRLPYLMKIGIVCIGFLLFLPITSAETLNVIYNTDNCVYQPHLNKDYCKTVYELCDPSLDMLKVDFKFKTESDSEMKKDIDELSYFYSSTFSKLNCRTITIEGYKNPFKNIDNILCYDSKCHEEYVWWNRSFLFKYPINASTTSGEVTMSVLLNDSSVTINNFPQYIWCNYTVNTTRRNVGYLYFTNESFYSCVDETETFQVFMNVDEGNGTSFGLAEKELLIWWHANETNTTDSGRYGINITDRGCNRVSNGKIGHSYNCDRGDVDFVEFEDSPFYDSMDDNEAYSWCIWMNADSWNVGLDSDHIIGTTSGTYPILVRRTTANSFISWFINTDGGDEVVDTTFLPSTGSWFHLCGTLGGTSQKIFVNGRQDAINTYNIGDMLNWGALDIGCWKFSGDRCIDGRVDEFMLWNRTLSNDEIQALYNNTVGNQNFAPLGPLEELSLNTSLLAINDELDDFVLTVSDFVDTNIINFNTSAANTSFLILSSMNIEKLTAGGTNVITVRIILDSNETILQEDLRTVSSIGDVGSTGTSPVIFMVGAGEHNITYQFKRSGPGNINITNFDFNLIEFITSGGNAVRNQLIITDFNHTDTSFTPAFNWSINKEIISPTFMLVKNTLSKTGLGSTVATYFFDNMVTGDTSPFWQRYLASSSDIGSVSGIHIDPSVIGDHNNSIQSRQTDGGNFVLANGSLVDFDLADSDNNTIPFFQVSNESTNLTDLISLGSGLHLLAESTVLNLIGNSYFISFFASFSTSSGAQTPRYFIDSPNLTNDQCFTEKERSLSGNNDIGNSFAYTICEGLSIELNYTFRLWVEVETGETLLQLDESMLGFETTNFSITEGQLAPIASPITNPLNGSSVNGSDLITWIAFVDPNEDIVTYNITLLNINGSLNSTIGITTDLSLPVNWFNFLPGIYFLRVEGCDPGILCSDSNVTIIILEEPTPEIIPSTTFCENNILRIQTSTRTIIGLNITDETIITRTLCQYGCSNTSLSNWGNPGCIESDLTLSAFLVLLVISVSILIWVVQR